MKYFKIIVVVVLFISVFMNIHLISRVGNLENSMNSLSNYQMDLMNNVNQQTDNVSAIMDEFKREQSWISSIQMDVEDQDIESGKATLLFDWQIKEMLDEAKVVFHYKYGDSEEYQSAPATEKGTGTGLFEVTIPIEMQLEPEWLISTAISGATDNVAEESKRVIEEKKMEEMNKSQLSYYVTVSNDDVLKSSEINSTHLGELGTRYYGLLDTTIQISDKSVFVSVMEHKNSSDIFIEEAYLIQYNNEQVEDEKKLVMREEDEDPYVVMREHYTNLRTQSSKDDFPFTSLVLKVVYSNGTSFEKEVFSK